MAQVDRDIGASVDELVFDLPGGGRALFTDRSTGNLSMRAGEDHERGLQRRHELCESLGLRWLCASPQVHGTDVQRVLDLTGSRGHPAPIDADGHATALPGVGTMVLGADCLPVALGCAGAVAMVHAGWRGLAAGALEQGVRAVRELGCGDEIVAIVGPAAGVCCYEVGPEVHRAFGDAHSHGRNIDLQAIARDRLRGAGVADVRAVGACTVCDERFFSHRREGQRAGRQAGISWLS
ncbi:MAG: polyphenol oxidase family protein [Solirubrobacteraceae bacterium]|jgi:YfiH family protein